MAKQKKQPKKKFEQRALAAIAKTKKRTWSILAVSHASPLYKAQRYEDAEFALYGYLARRDLLEFSRQQFRELLDVVLDEQALPEGYKYSGEEIILTLRGDDIGRGTAPLDLVLQKAAGVKHVVARTAELQGEFPFRQTGLPPREVSEFSAQPPCPSRSPLGAATCRRRRTRSRRTPSNIFTQTSMTASCVATSS